MLIVCDTIVQRVLAGREQSYSPLKSWRATSSKKITEPQINYSMESGSKTLSMVCSCPLPAFLSEIQLGVNVSLNSISTYGFPSPAITLQLMEAVMVSEGICSVRVKEIQQGWLYGTIWASVDHLRSIWITQTLLVKGNCQPPIHSVGCKIWPLMEFCFLAFTTH